MALLPAYFTTTSYRKRKVKKKTSISKHEQWLLSKGVHLEQIKLKKTKNNNWKKEYSDSLKVDRPSTVYESSGLSGNASSCINRSIMANLHKESEETRAAILAKAARTAPLYSKGPYQYITDGTNLDDVGKKK